MKVRDLVGGDVITMPGATMHATFIGRSDHPKYAGLALVVWVLSNGTVSPDALSYDQEVGELSCVRGDGWDDRLVSAMALAKMAGR